jgi:hypothetical protein
MLASQVIIGRPASERYYSVPRAVSLSLPQRLPRSYTLSLDYLASAECRYRALLARTPEAAIACILAPTPGNNALIYPFSIATHAVGTQPVGHSNHRVPGMSAYSWTAWYKAECASPT